MPHRNNSLISPPPNVSFFSILSKIKLNNKTTNATIKPNNIDRPKPQSKDNDLQNGKKSKYILSTRDSL